MNGVDGLAESLKYGMKRVKKKSEQKAQRGVIQGGRVHIGERSYPMTAAVDVGPNVSWFATYADGEHEIWRCRYFSIRYSMASILFNTGRMFIWTLLATIFWIQRW